MKKILISILLMISITFQLVGTAANADSTSEQTSIYDEINSVGPAVTAGDYSKLETLILNIFKQIDRNSLDAAPLNVLLSKAYRIQGKYGQAEKIALDSIKILDDNHVKDSRMMGALIALGEIKQATEKYSEAEKLYQQALILNDDSEIGQSTRANAYSSYGSLKTVQGKFYDAEQYLKTALILVNKKNPALAWGYLLVENNLGEALYLQNKLTEAENLLTQTLLETKRICGNDSPNSIYIMSNLALVYEGQSRYSEAEALLKKSREILAAEGETDRNGVELIANNLSVVYLDELKYSDAKKLLEDSLQTESKAASGNKHLIATELGNLALIEDNQGNAQHAADLYAKSIDACLNAYGKDNLQSAIPLLNLGLLELKQCKYSESELRLKQAQEITSKSFGEGGISGTNRFLELADKERYISLEDLLKNDFSYFADAKPELVALSQELTKANLSSQTITRSRQILEDSSLNLKQENALIISILCCLANRKKISAPCLPILAKAAAQMETRYGDKDFRFGLINLQEAATLEALNAPGQSYAVAAYTCLNSQPGNLGSSEERLLANLAIPLSYLLASGGNFNRARDCSNLAARHLKKSNMSSTEIAKKLLVCAEFQRLQGNYQDARNDLQDARNVRPFRDEIEASCDLINAETAYQVGDYAVAADFAKKARGRFSISDLQIINCDTIVARSFFNLYQNVKINDSALGADYLTQAIRESKTAFATANKLLGADNLDSISATLVLAAVTLAQGQVDASKKLLLAADAITQKTEQNDAVARSNHAIIQTQIGLLNLQQNKILEARANFAKAYEIQSKETSTEATLNTAANESWLAWTTLILNDSQLARRYAFDCASRLDKYIDRNFSQLSFAEQCSFLDGLDELNSRIIAVCKNTDGFPEIYTFLARWKGLLVYSLNRQSEIIKLGATRPDLKPLIENMKERERQLVAFSQISNPKLARADVRTQSDQILRDYEISNRELSNRAGLQLIDPLSNLSGGKFDDKLDFDECFVDICTYQSVSDLAGINSPYRYGAVLIPSQQVQGIGLVIGLDKQKRLIAVATYKNSSAESAGIKPNDLIETIDGKDTAGKSITEAASIIRGPTNTRTNLGIKRLGQNLEYSLIRKSYQQQYNPIFIDLGPISEVDNDVQTWLSTLSGERNLSSTATNSFAASFGKSRTINSVDSESLSEETNEKDARERFNQHFWKKLRGAIHDVQPVATKIWLCADGNLTRLPWSLLVDAQNFSVFQVDSPREFVQLKSRISQSGNSILLAGGLQFGNPKIPSLPGTGEEITAIAKIANAQNFEVKQLTERTATKDAFSKEMEKVSWVHLATHGFFDNDQSSKTDLLETKAIRSAPILRDGNNSAGAFIFSRNPLLRSGILLSGQASVPDQVPTQPSLGNRFTAQEVIDLDLHKSVLVTLSACDTGRGTEQTGQGVLGLRSAIISAGASCVLMSLWKVDDEATKFLMERFYSRLWTGDKKLTIAQALQAAQIDVRENERWQHPFYWAAWTLAGKAGEYYKSAKQEPSQKDNKAPPAMINDN